MDSFSYVAIGMDGKEKKGSMEAASVDKVKAQLKADGLIPVKVATQSALSKDLNITIGGGVKSRDLSLFCRQFVGILSTGVSIISALDMMSEQTNNKRLATAIRDTQIAVEKGDNLATAMRMQGKVFPPILINMVEAGEASGNLEIAFERMASHFEKENKLKALIKKAAIYPCVVGIVALIVIIVMLVVVIPKFENLFASMGSELPLITKIIKNASDFIIAKWYFLLLALVAMIGGVIAFKKSPKGEMFFSKMALKIPVFGKLNVKTYSARYARTISTLLVAGIPLIEALEMTAKTIDNKIVRDVLLNAKTEVARGVPLSVPIKASGIFPPMVHHMTHIGEETGNIEGMLNRLADYYDEEVEIASQGLTAALEPMIIIVLAGIVCLLIAAIMGPMLQMYKDMDNIM